MALNTIDAKITVKTSTISGGTPTIGPSNDHTDGTWGVDDIYPGEFYYNSTDEKLWIGTSLVTKELKMFSTGETIYTNVELELGDWNMDTTDAITVTHGLSATEWKTVRNITSIIRIDSDTDYIDFSSNNGAQRIEVNSANFVIRRVVGGYFDSASFDATSFNRGWINFKYIPD